jgi:hypothetical protein
MDTPKLKSKTRTFICVRWIDLRDFIQKTYGGNLFSCLDTENGSNIRADVTPENRLDVQEAAEWELAIKYRRIEGWRLKFLFQGFADKGLLPYGEYLINVSW